MRVRMLTVCLLVLGGWLCSRSLAADGSFAAPVEAATSSVAVQQQPLSTIPPLPQSPAERFSTIPPLPPTSTPIRPLPTQVQAPTPLPTRAARERGKMRPRARPSTVAWTVRHRERRDAEPRLHAGVTLADEWRESGRRRARV